MGLRLLLGVIVSLLATHSGLAEVARMRSGEHGDFTRIVIESPALQDWQFGRSDDGYAFVAGGGIEDIDHSQVFTKISRSRIAALSTDPAEARLLIHLACSCHANAFELRSGTVVIDIRNGTAPKGSPFESWLPLPEIATAEAEEEAQARGEEGRVESDKSPLVGYNWRTLAAPPRDREYASIAPQITGPPLRSALEEAARQPLMDLLHQYLARGAEEGVVALEAQLPKRAETPPPPEAEGFRVTDGISAGLSAETPRKSAPELTLTGKPCLSPPRLDLPQWAGEDPASQELGRYRRSLMAEFDQPDQTVLTAAIRHYLGLGFGAEARQLLGLLPAEAPDRALYTSLSRLVDLEKDPSAYFADQSNCDTEAALWAALSLALEEPVDLAKAHGLNLVAVSQHFAELSPQLRAHLAPKLIDLALAIADRDLAKKLSRSAQRPLRAPPAALSLAEARLALGSDEAEDAQRISTSLLASAPENAVEAAILLVDAAFSGTRTLPAGTADQIAALLPEARQQRRDDALLRAESLAAAMEGNHNRAFALLAQIPQAAPDVWELSSTTMEEELFLEKALEALAGESPRPKPETVSNIAERLMQAGFASEALSWMAALPKPLREEHLLFVAEAHLSLRQAPQALAALAGMTSPEADAIRAKIFLQLGEPASAAQIYARAGALEESQRANLIAGDYGAIAEIGTPLWRDVAAMAVTDSTVETEGPLAQAHAIGESSAALRQSVERLLTAVPPPADP